MECKRKRDDIPYAGISRGVALLICACPMERITYFSWVLSRNILLLSCIILAAPFAVSPTCESRNTVFQLLSSNADPFMMWLYASQWNLSIALTTPPLSCMLSLIIILWGISPKVFRMNKSRKVSLSPAQSFSLLSYCFFNSREVSLRNLQL